MTSLILNIFLDLKADADSHEIKPKKAPGQGFGNIFSDPKGKALFDKIASKQSGEDRPDPPSKQVDVKIISRPSLRLQSFN